VTLKTAGVTVSPQRDTREREGEKNLRGGELV